MSADKILSTLLSHFVSAVESGEDVFTEKGKTREQKLLQLISSNFKHILKNITDNPSYYQKLLLITDFISGMTDSYALSLYQELIGVKSI